MKRITASEARRNWFQLLDRAAAGEVVLIERNGRRIVLRREEEGERSAAVPDYRTLIRPVGDVEGADRWSWAWDSSAGLHPHETDSE